jgi:pSer/pThr/pTyr-binding forkhead associated (FHA) protein
MAKMLLVHDGAAQEVQMGQEITIGRAYSNLLRLEGDEISRVHAIIYRRGADYIIRDLDSKNGVYLNGERVTTSIITSDDEVRIGSYVLLFDPTGDSDVTGFLRRYKVQSPDEAVIVDPSTSQEGELRKAEPPPVDADADAKRVVGSTQVFFGVPETEQMSDSGYGTYSAMFLSDLLRMHRRLSLPFPMDANGHDPIYTHFLNAAVSSLGADRGVIVLKERGSEALKLAAIYPKDRDLAVNRTVLRATLRNREAVLCNDVGKDDRFLQTDTVVKERIGSLIAYPLIKADGVGGLIYCDIHEKTNGFRRDHLLLLHFLSRLLMLSTLRDERR